jgi:uncharacterized protein DUF1552
MSSSRRLSRRTVLRGLGTAVALPMLDAMLPRSVRAAASAVSKPSPLRMAVVFIPNGAHMADWTPAGVGSSFKMPAILEPLAPFRQELLVLTGLTQDNARSHGDGGGDHARSAATFLTGTHPRKTNGANIQAGVSFDQVAAQQLGSKTRFPSLEIGCDRGQQAGSCDSGYSCAYSSNISWRSESTPMAKEINPRLVFERLFASDDQGGNAESRAKRELYRKSVLDFVLEDAQRLKASLGGTDRRKLDEYLTSVRELETRIRHHANHDRKDEPELERPEGIPKDYEQHIRLMCDLMVLAFQSDATRIATFMLANEGSNRSYPFIGVAESHHDLSHHGGNKDKQEKIRKINIFHVRQFAYLLDKLKNARDGEQSLLDNSMILYGGGISDGNRHNHDDLPILMAGKGGGLRGGRHVRYPKNTPLNNLFLSLLDRMDVPASALGDSTGQLENLDG